MISNTRFKRLMAACAVILGAQSVFAAGASAELQTVQATACESPAVYDGSLIEAREAALERARRSALEAGGVFLQQEMTVTDFVLTDQQATSAAAGTLTNVQILKEEQAEDGKKFCITISADVDPDEIRRQMADQQAFRSALTKRSQFLGSPKNPQCLDEVVLDNTFKFLVADWDINEARAQALANAKLEGIDSVQYTVLNSFTEQSIREDNGDIDERFTQRMKARSQGMARATVWKEDVVQEGGKDTVRFETVALVCVPKDPGSLPLPIYFDQFDGGNGVNLGRWQGKLASSISAKANVSQVNSADLAEVVMSVKVSDLRCFVRTVGAKGSARLPAGRYEVVSIALIGTGVDQVTGKSFTDEASGERYFSTSNACESNKAKHMETLVQKLAESMYVRAMQTYRTGSAAGEEQPKKRRKIRF